MLPKCDVLMKHMPMNDWFLCLSFQWILRVRLCTRTEIEVENEELSFTSTCNAHRNDDDLFVSNVEIGLIFIFGMKMSLEVLGECCNVKRGGSKLLDDRILQSLRYHYDFE